MKEQEQPGGRIVITATGFGWGTGWLFTIGFAHLGFGKALFALVVWPLFLGQALSP